MGDEYIWGREWWCQTCNKRVPEEESICTPESFRVHKGCGVILQPASAKPKKPQNTIPDFDENVDWLSFYQDSKSILQQMDAKNKIQSSRGALSSRSRPLLSVGSSSMPSASNMALSSNMSSAPRMQPQPKNRPSNTRPRSYTGDMVDQKEDDEMNGISDGETRNLRRNDKLQGDDMNGKKGKGETPAIGEIDIEEDEELNVERAAPSFAVPDAGVLASLAALEEEEEKEIQKGGSQIRLKQLLKKASCSKEQGKQLNLKSSFNSSSKETLVIRNGNNGHRDDDVTPHEAFDMERSDRDRDISPDFLNDPKSDDEEMEDVDDQIKESPPDTEISITDGADANGDVDMEDSAVAALDRLIKEETSKINVKKQQQRSAEWQQIRASGPLQSSAGQQQLDTPAVSEDRRDYLDEPRVMVMHQNPSSRGVKRRFVR